MNTKTLYLCEKPSQARILAKHLGAVKSEDGAFVSDDVIVIHAYGQLLNLAMPDNYLSDKSWTLSSLPILPQQWVWEVKPKHIEHFKQIGIWLGKADSVIIATDPDAEGEVIGRQILNSHGYSGPVKRLWMSALDANSLSTGLANLMPLSATDAVYRVGRIRHELDWLFGMNLSRAFSVAFNNTSRIGRVKTRLLNELVDRESEIERFAPVWFNAASMTLGDMRLEWDGQDSALFYGDVTQVFSGSHTGYCVSDEVETIIEEAPAPYSLSALLIDAAELGVSLADGASAAQSLYEAGAISYPRTSSTDLPSSGNQDFATHHAIITTGSCPSWMNEDGQTLFSLIQQNEFRHCLGAAKIMEHKTVFDFGGQRFIGRKKWLDDVRHGGWLHTIHNRCESMMQKPERRFQSGEQISGPIQVERRVTQAPERHTEASILRRMVDMNVGTEATRVDAIGGLYKDLVASVDGARVVQPSSTGKALIERLPQSVRGDAMETMIQKAQNSVRQGQQDFSPNLIAATKWLAKTIQGVTAKQ